MVLIYRLLVNDVAFVEAFQNASLKKFLGSLTKSEAKKSFHQRRLGDDGNWNATASRLVLFKSIWVKETALHFAGKYNQSGGSMHLTIYMCFGHDDTHPAPKVRPSES